jgi:serine/threonine protein kinase
MRLFSFLTLKLGQLPVYHTVLYSIIMGKFRSTPRIFQSTIQQSVPDIYHTVRCFDFVDSSAHSTERVNRRRKRQFCTMASSELDGLRKACLTPGNLAELYTIGRVIGKGGFAVVREGSVKKTGAVVALKVLNPKAYLQNPAQARMLFHEISTLQRVTELSSPNLLKFVGAHEDLGKFPTLPLLTFKASTFSCCACVYFCVFAVCVCVCVYVLQVRRRSRG